MPRCKALSLVGRNALDYERELSFRASFGRRFGVVGGFSLKSVASVLVVAAMTLAAACTDPQFGTGPVPAFADASAPGQVDASAPDAEAGASACARLPAIRAPQTCNGDPGSCPAGLLCEIVGFSRDDGSGEQSQCGVACGTAPTACPTGAFCSTGIGRAGGVCLTLLASGSVFGIGAQGSYATCADAGAVACSAGKAFGVNERHDFQGWCVCGAPPGAPCGADSECSNLKCNADKKCGAAANDACTPLGTSETALLPETECRTTCSRSTCTCEPACKTDADCGGPNSGRICNASSTCVGGCRGIGGNGCASSFDHCSSRTSAVGICTDAL